MPDFSEWGEIISAVGRKKHEIEISSMPWKIQPVLCANTLVCQILGRYWQVTCMLMNTRYSLNDKYPNAKHSNRVNINKGRGDRSAGRDSKGHEPLLLGLHDPWKPLELKAQPLWPPRTEASYVDARETTCGRSAELQGSMPWPAPALWFLSSRHHLTT